MTFLPAKTPAASSWGAVAGASALASAAPASNLSAVLLEGEAARRNLPENGWFDVEFINFSSETKQFISITEGTLRAGILHQTHAVGRLMYTSGIEQVELVATQEEFTFADPVEDIQQIKQGIIKALRP